MDCSTQIFNRNIFSSNKSNGLRRTSFCEYHGYIIIVPIKQNKKYIFVSCSTNNTTPTIMLISTLQTQCHDVPLCWCLYFLPIVHKLCNAIVNIEQMANNRNDIQSTNSMHSKINGIFIYYKIICCKCIQSIISLLIVGNMYTSNCRRMNTMKIFILFIDQLLMYYDYEADW